jgi:hypothetical protein
VPRARPSLGREEGKCSRQNRNPFVVDPETHSFERIADSAALVRASDLLGGVKAFSPKLGLDHKNKTQKEIDHE